MARNTRAVEVLAAWPLILEIAARCPTRGLLVDDHGEALTSADLADLTLMPQSIFDVAFDVLSSEGIGWIELTDIPARADRCRGLLEPAGICRSLPQSAGPPGPTDTGQDRDKAAAAACGRAGAREATAATLLQRMGLPKGHSLSAGIDAASSAVLSVWAHRRADARQPDKPGRFIAKIIADDGLESPPLTAKAICDAVSCGIVESMRVPGGDWLTLKGADIKHNGKGLYIDGKLAVACDQFSESEYA